MEFVLQQVVCAALGALSWFLGIRRIRAQADGRRNLVAGLAGLRQLWLRFRFSLGPPKAHLFL